MTEVTDRTPSLEDQVAELSGFDHVTHHIDDFGSSYVDGNIHEAPVSESNIISSEVLGMTGRTGWHSIVLDIDYPCRAVPSSTEGHSHLYIDKRLTWHEYEALLEALARANVVQRGYVNASIKRGFTALRLPWIKKENA